MAVLEDLRLLLRRHAKYAEQVYVKFDLPENETAVGEIRKALLEESQRIWDEISDVWTPIAEPQWDTTFSYRGHEKVPWDYIAAFERGRYAAVVSVRQEASLYVLVLTVGWHIDDADDDDSGDSGSGVEARVAVLKPYTRITH